jgi:hypothetical protein
MRRTEPDMVTIPAARLLGRKVCVRCGRELADVSGFGLECQACGLLIKTLSQGQDINGPYLVAVLREGRQQDSTEDRSGECCPQCGGPVKTHRCQVWCERCGMVESCEG